MPQKICSAISNSAAPVIPKMAPSAGGSSLSPNSLKLAVAVAILRFKNQRPPPSSSPTAAQRWKQKVPIPPLLSPTPNPNPLPQAKDRKREILKLREELKQLEDAAQQETLPEIASCRCHFFDGCSTSAASACGDGHWINEVLRRRFMRLVRWKERNKKVECSIQRRHFLEFGSESEIERLGTSIDFLVELSDTLPVKGGSDSLFATFSHQAVDFILASAKNLLSLKKDDELVEETVNGLITRLTKRMCTITESDRSSESGSHSQFCVQHLIRKLGTEPFIGQRVLLLVSQKISVAAEHLLFMDPFDEAFLANHDSMYMMIQLIEFLITDYMRNWTGFGDFDTRLFEEWVRSILLARKALVPLECRNGLYMLYIERVVGELVKQVDPLRRQGKLDLDILSQLLL